MEEKLQILIVDDDLIDRRALSRAMRKSFPAVEIEEAESLRQVWEKIGIRPWDCIFLDYLMPGGDGLEVLKLFRQKGFGMPVIIVTSQGDEKIAVETIRAGGSDYITKDIIDSEVLGKVVRNALRTFKAEEESRKTSKALAESEARLVEAQRIANLGCWEWDVATENEYWTEQVFHIFGRQDGSNRVMPAHSFLRHLHRDCRNHFADAMQRCIHQRQQIKIDLRIVTESQEVIPCELHGKPVLDVGGKLVKVVGTLQDISSRKRIEQELLDARDLAERNAIAKQEFLANMSHEIRTPMNAILGFAKLLMGTPLSTTQAEYLQAIDQSGEVLLSIIDDILDISKIEAGRVQIETIAFRPADLLRAVHEICRAKATEKQIDLHSNLGPGVPEWVMGDVSRLKQVLLNLTGNAVKFTERGEVGMEIKLIEQNAKGVRLLFEVADTGIGIPEEKRNAIFESFTQASTDTTRKYGGTGLGLTISRRLVKLMGGDIGVESTVGEGSCFYFDLTFALPQPVEEAEPVKQKTPIGQGDAKRALKIMVVDDNGLNQRLATIVLENLGYSFVVARNGLEALESLPKERPDLVLMDVQMPVMDGLEATRCIRKLENPELSSVPIIALTAHALRPEIEKCLEAGMDDFLAKPFQPAELEAKIASLLPAQKQSGTLLSASSAPEMSISGLQEYVGHNRKLQADLTEAFLAHVPKAIQKLRAAMEIDDLETLRRVTHSIKPSLILFGLPNALVTDVEAALRNGQPNPLLKQCVQALIDGATDACTQLMELGPSPEGGGTEVRATMPDQNL